MRLLKIHGFEFENRFELMFADDVSVLQKFHFEGLNLKQ